MAAADTARLIASLELDDKKFGPRIDKSIGKMGKLETSMDRIGAHAKRGIGNAARNVAMLGVAATVAVGGMVVAGVRSLAHLQRVEAQTAAVLESTGGAAGVTAKEVRALAEEIENLTTVDDKNVQEASNLLLTFTKIGKKTFPQATKAAINMAIALAGGDVEAANFSGAALQIGKALNDPIKGITALSRAGVSFTAEQKKRIKGLVKEGRVFEAQQLILKELETEFGKAGAAAGSGPEAAWRRLQDAGEDLSQVLARTLLPVLEKGAKWLTTKLSSPGAIKMFKDLGEAISDMAEELLRFVDGIDWKAVGSGLKVAAGAARGIVSAFMSMPDWVKTAVIGGWGLNKLTGGALGGIVGELGKGLIKGVLGMNAGVVNVNAGVVNGAGGVPGVAGKGGGLGKAALGITGVGIAAVIANEFSDEIIGVGKEIGRGWRGAVEDTLGVKIPTISTSQLQWPFGPKNTPKILPEIFGGNGLLGGTGAAPKSGGTVAKGNDRQGYITAAVGQQLVDANVRVGDKIAVGNEKTYAGIDNLRATVEVAKAQGVTDAHYIAAGADRASAEQKARIDAGATKSATAASLAGFVAAGASRNAGTAAANASLTGANRIVGAIWAARPIISPVTIHNTNVTTQRGAERASDRNRE